MSNSWPSPTVQTLPDQVAEAILQRVASGELQPGQRLPSQRKLAHSMGVGLAVIREAVQRLAALNIVEATHGSGTIIRPFRWLPLLYDKSLFHLAMQRIGIRDLWEARRLLEGQIISLAVQRRTKSNLGRMRAVLDAANRLPVTYEEARHSTKSSIAHLRKPVITLCLSISSIHFWTCKRKGLGTGSMKTKCRSLGACTRRCTQRLPPRTGRRPSKRSNDTSR